MFSFFSSALWVPLSLLSTFTDASVGYIDEWLLKHVVGDKARHHADAPGRLILISGFFGIVISFFIFLALILLHRVDIIIAPRASVSLAVLAGMLEIVWLIPYFYALQRGGALNVTPLFQTVPIFSFVFGLFFFNEVPTAIQIVAVLLVICGALLLNYIPSTKRMDYQTILLMLLASSVISLGYFFFKDAAELTSFVTTLFWNGIGMTILSSLVWTIWGPYRRQFHEFLKGLNVKIFLAQVLNEGLYSISSIANQMAVVLGPSVTVVTALGASHPVFTLFIGWFLARYGSPEYKMALSKNRLIQKTAAICLVAVGTAIMAFG